MSWHYSRALVEAYSEENCLDGEPCVQLKSTNTQGMYWSPDKMTDALSRSQSGMIYEPLTGDRGKELLTWFRAGFHAKTYHVLEKEQESPVNDLDCGTKCGESFAKLDQDSRSWKTRQCLLLGGLESFSETWPKWGMMRDGVCWELSIPARLTRGIESGYLPTLGANEDSYRLNGNSQQSKSLGALARKEALGQPMWPTPRAGKTTDEDEETWLIRHAAGKVATPPLTLAVKMWLTPRVFMYKDSTTDRGKGNLGERVGGQLNPTWVELLMGWPMNWTCVSPISHVYYLQWLMEVCNDEKTRTQKALRMLRRGNAAEELSRAIRRPVNIFEAAILFSILCEQKNRPNQARLFMACAKALENEVRGMRPSAQVAGASYKSEDIRQWTREHPDAMQALSRFLAYFGEEAWKNGSWENAVPRVANNVAARVDRLKVIGNGQVPAVVKLAWEMLS